LILVYTPNITTRVDYAFRLIFSEVLNVDVRLTDSQAEYCSFNGPRLNYSEEELDGIKFVPVGLLTSKNIEHPIIEVQQFEDTVAFFKTQKGNDLLSFDVFSASFFLVTRMEEYSDSVLDHHGRYKAENSLAFKNQFLKTPLVNSWAQKLKMIFADKYPSVEFPDLTFRFISTIDVDNAFAFKEKGMLRTLGAYVKDLTKGNYTQADRRKKVLIGLEKDPYDTYQLIKDLKDRFGHELIYFFLVGNYGKYDRSVNYKNLVFRKLIKELSSYADIGIHPSYRSNSKNRQVNVEVQRLEKITGKTIQRSRQHFLKMNIPVTYRSLIDSEIKADYTMGYASQVGFRASICTPFSFFDLEREQTTDLIIYPFAYMDGTLNEYMKLSCEQANEVVQELMDNVKAVNGWFISIWHNETLNNERHWEGWRAVYEKMISNV